MGWWHTSNGVAAGRVQPRARRACVVPQRLDVVDRGGSPPFQLGQACIQRRATARRELAALDDRILENSCACGHAKVHEVCVVLAVCARGAEEDVRRLHVIVDVASLVQAPKALDDVAPDLEDKRMPLCVAFAQHGLDIPAQEAHHEHVARPAEDRLTRIVMQHNAAPLAAHRTQNLGLKGEP